MSKEGMVIFAHLSVQDTERVRLHLVRRGLWNPVDMVYDTDADLLMTTGERGAETVREVLTELDLLPTGETTFRPVGEYPAKAKS